MKPQPFTYHAPQSRPELFALLGALEDARCIAGGQSLMPMMNLRLAAPAHLVDLNGIADLAGIRVENDRLVIGAMTRQRAAEHSALVAETCPLLTKALDHVGFQQTRNRGTVGGSVAHMDPTAEIVTACCALDADVVLEGPDGERRMPISAFNTGYLSTSIAPGEILSRLEIPLWPAGHGSAFLEVTRRGESFSVVSVAALVALDAEGAIARAALAVGGLGPAPFRLHAADASAGRPADDDFIAALGAEAAMLPADGDFSASDDYKQHLAGVLTRRAMRAALLAAGARHD
ncbi:xanthine dehydrogenase family protein subunit M [Xanthobacter sp. KR7-65]|uniref:FAD binding domain-containing protein n=1 Tax=Xanthobacter sp. KR7-65 TaxID=3156612 RepID=UPI0032B327C9